MDTKIITEASAGATSGQIPFPEMVRRLGETGVEYYHVDYVTMRKSCYSANGEVITIPITFEGLPGVAAEFDAIALTKAIRDSQQGALAYRDFSRRAME